jgi:hypothetical protein
MKANGFPNLIEHELSVSFMFRRRHTLRAAGNLDGIGIHHPNPLQEFAKSKFKPVIEAPQDSGVAMILFARSIEVEYFLHNTLLDGSCQISSYPTNSGPGRLRCHRPPQHDKIARTRLSRSYP